MKRSFYLKTKILLGFALVLAAIVLTSIIAYNSFEQLSRSVQILSRQDTRLQQIDSILFMVNQSENSLQEYTIEKSQEKISRYDALVSEIRKRVQQLNAVSAFDNNSLDSILNLINAKLVSMDEFMEIREQRDDFRLYDEALKQLEEKPLAELNPSEESQTPAPLPESENIIPEQEKDFVSEQDDQRERGWFGNIIDKIFKNKNDKKDSLSQDKPVLTEADVVQSQDTLIETDSDVSNLTIDSVRQILLSLKSEQAATEEYLNRQELAYLATNARVMNRINELVSTVKLERQREYTQQSQEAKLMLRNSLSRLGIILVIALGSTFIFVYFIFADIAKSDFLKQQLEQAKERAEQLARVKESFLANMSHEIRTPLTAILGFTALLSQSALNRKQQEYVSAVDSSSSHLLSLVNDILDFSKIEAGQLRFETQAFDITQLIAQVCADMHIHAEKKNLQLITETEGEELRFVKGDAFRLKQVLYNLISNAIKFTKEGGVIVRVRLKPLDDNNVSAQVEVIDSGIGIPREKQHHIFDAFVQSDVSDTRRYGGTGLGLSISKRIIESQGGEIALESEPGEGTTFYIALPFLKSEESHVLNQGKTIDEQISFPGLKLLVIDDDPLNTELISLMLEKLNVECLVANHGQEGLDKLQTETVDLILSDLQMPEMSGEEVVIAAREMGQNDVPIIAFTARVTESKDYYRQKGFDDVLHKPFKEDDIAELLRKYARRFIQFNQSVSKREVKTEELQSDAVRDELYSFDNIRRFIGDDQESLIGFVDSFLKGLRDSIQNIETALDEDDAHTVGYHAHRLFPNVSQLQVAELPTLLRKMENVAKSDLSVLSIKEEAKQALRICRQLEGSLSAIQEKLKARVS